jgi:NADP-dependent 3-hydroxy acid dehydrogenase YdfG
MPERDPAETRAAPPVIVVTGGLSGIGEAVAIEFAGLGAAVVIGDIRVDRREAVAARIAAAGGESRILETDVRDPDQLDRLAAEALSAFGRIDALVVCAGTAAQGQIDTGDPLEQRTIVETNLLGSIYAVRSPLPAMRARGKGHIFLVSSVAGREWHAGEAVYIASKWGQVGLAHALRQDIRELGIRVTVVEPGLVDTPLTRDNPNVRPLLDQVRALAPLDVARAVRFAFGQPDDVLISELTIRPLRQPVPNFPSHSPSR